MDFTGLSADAIHRRQFLGTAAGGFGSLALGHNHPRILAARRRFQDEKRHEIAIAFMSQYAATLAHNLAQIAPEDLEHVFLATAGSEAVEYALKIAERISGWYLPLLRM